MPPSGQVIITALVPGAIAMVRLGLRTVTVKVQPLVLPQASVAMAVTVLVESRLKKVPEGGVDVMVTELQVSVAVTDQKTWILVLHVSMRMFEGHVIVGRLVSRIVTV